MHFEEETRKIVRERFLSKSKETVEPVATTSFKVIAHNIFMYVTFVTFADIDLSL